MLIFFPMDKANKGIEFIDVPVALDRRWEMTHFTISLSTNWYLNGSVAILVLSLNSGPQSKDSPQ